MVKKVPFFLYGMARVGTTTTLYRTVLKTVQYLSGLLI